MSAIRSGGALLQLPREIRDEIYSHYFSKIYLVCWSYYDPQNSDSVDYESQNHDGHILADLAILQVSKVISSDAKQYLFSNAASTATAFKYVIDFHPWKTFSIPPTKEATDRMRNIEFQVRSYGLHNIHPVLHLDPICVDRFAGTEVIRDNFYITFQIDFALRENLLRVFMETRFFLTLKELKGFQKLTVALKRSVEFWLGWDEEHVKDLWMVRMVWMELEPYLGPSLVKGLHVRPSKVRSYEKDLVLELEFQPFKFHVETLRAEAAILTKEAERLEGKDVQFEAERSGL
ncbi:MAG: hypothetical protein ALECFALPRED_006098 [Alectoria fallacina]|uniref:Uncharacterized protein n=1 Tax=Alectoria fallacina TaxID=1903189 RepID=A0A8H3I9C4_9LECA|nr:MAG: hypothetical protein ALECFALPRED_006098 [Alectoria fallacina]